MLRVKPLSCKFLGTDEKACKSQNQLKPETKANYGKPKTRFSYILSHLNKKTDRDSSYNTNLVQFQETQVANTAVLCSHSIDSR